VYTDKPKIKNKWRTVKGKVEGVLEKRDVSKMRCTKEANTTMK